MCLRSHVLPIRLRCKKRTFSCRRPAQSHKFWVLPKQSVDTRAPGFGVPHDSRCHGVPIHHPMARFRPGSTDCLAAPRIVSFASTEALWNRTDVVRALCFKRQGRGSREEAMLCRNVYVQVSVSQNLGKLRILKQGSKFLA